MYSLETCFFPSILFSRFILELLVTLSQLAAHYLTVQTHYVHISILLLTGIWVVLLASTLQL